MVDRSVLAHFLLHLLHKYEAPNLHVRDVATVTTEQNLTLGTVVARDATDKLETLDSTAVGSASVAVGLFVLNIDATPITEPTPS